jgi:DNA/RNA endonuclease YhcR with UshA esterase domain
VIAFPDAGELRCRISAWEKREMNRSMGWTRLAACAAILLVAQGTMAQQKAASAAQLQSAYNVSREVSLQGTVVSFAENSAAPAIGPRMLLQTASGQVDVHLGNVRLLQASELTLAQGDNVRVVGENVQVGSGTQFVARLLQKGNQTVALRSTRGFPLRPAAVRGGSKEGVL